MDSDVKHALLGLISENRDLIRTARFGGEGADRCGEGRAGSGGEGAMNGTCDIRIVNGVLWFKAHSIGDGDDVYASGPGLEVFMRPADIRTVHLGRQWLIVWDTHGTRYHVVVADENGHEVVAQWIREFAMGETGGAA